jgi:hypothetical protein
MKGSHGLSRCLSVAALIASAAVAFAGSATVTLTNRHQVVARPLTGQVNVVYSGILTTSGPFNGATMILQYAFRKWAYSARPEYTYAPQLISFLSDLGVQQNGGVYQGPMFIQEVTPTLPGGLYDHSGAGMNAPAYCYLRFSGSAGTWETNRDFYSLAITGAEKQVSIDLNDPTFPDDQWASEFKVSMYQGNTLLAEENVYSFPDGTLQIDRMLPDGDVEFRIQGGHWLARRISLNLSNGYSIGNPLTLLNGDIDQDNNVGILDYIYISSNFGKNPDSPDFYDEDASGIAPYECDLDADGEISILDYIILSSNYGLDGDV